jgi:hypothetical protein
MWEDSLGNKLQRYDSYFVSLFPSPHTTNSATIWKCFLQTLTVPFIYENFHPHSSSLKKLFAHKDFQWSKNNNICSLGQDVLLTCYNDIYIFLFLSTWSKCDCFGNKGIIVQYLHNLYCNILSEKEIKLTYRQYNIWCIDDINSSYLKGNFDII